MTPEKVDMDKVRQQAIGISLLVLDVDGVLTDGHLHFDAKGNECKIFHVRDGYGIRRVLEAGIEVAITSGRKSVPVQKRASELGIQHVFLGASEKIVPFELLLKKLGIDSTAAACVGDDTPDVECMRKAGLAIAVADAHPDLDSVAHWRTRLGGGKGAVREVCDLLLSVRN